jgi:hypothetical protein
LQFFSIEINIHKIKKRKFLKKIKIKNKMVLYGLGCGGLLGYGGLGLGYAGLGLGLGILKLFVYIFHI